MVTYMPWNIHKNVLLQISVANFEVHWIYLTKKIIIIKPSKDRGYYTSILWKELALVVEWAQEGKCKNSWPASGGQLFGLLFKKKKNEKGRDRRTMTFKKTLSLKPVTPRPLLLRVWTIGVLRSSTSSTRVAYTSLGHHSRSHILGVDNTSPSSIQTPLRLCLSLGAHGT